LQNVTPWQSSRASAQPLAPTRPMALGSSAGCIVPPDPRLLWPYPRLCSPPSGLMFMSAWPCALAPAYRGSPIYSASPFTHAVVRTPVVPATARRWFCLRQISSGSATTVIPQLRTQWVAFSKLQRLLYATAWSDCLPCSGQGFYYRAFLGRVAPKPKSVMTRWLNHFFTIAGLSPAGLAALWAANRVEQRRERD